MTGIEKNRTGWCKAIPFFLAVILCFSLADVADAESYKVLREKRPDLFHETSGYRISRQRAPTPDDIPSPAVKIDTERAAALAAEGAILLDVFGALQSRFDELDGRWLVGKKRSSLPGAVWLPETGRGTLQPVIQEYLETNLKKLSADNFNRPIVAFCVADCWMSWNAAQRIAKLGYTNVYWFALGTDGWLESGRELQPIEPVPVDVE